MHVRLKLCPPLLNSSPEQPSSYTLESLAPYEIAFISLWYEISLFLLHSVVMMMLVDGGGDDEYWPWRLFVSCCLWFLWLFASTILIYSHWYFPPLSFGVGRRGPCHRTAAMKMLLYWLLETPMMTMVMMMLFCACVTAVGDICRWWRCDLPTGSSFAFNYGCGVGGWDPLPTFFFSTVAFSLAVVSLLLLLLLLLLLSCCCYRRLAPPLSLGGTPPSVGYHPPSVVRLWLNISGLDWGWRRVVVFHLVFGCLNGASSRITFNHFSDGGCSWYSTFSSILSLLHSFVPRIV